MMLNVALKTIPCRGAPKERVIVPWWNSDCDKAVKMRTQAFKNLHRCPIQENVICFKQCRALARETIKEAKKKSWRSLCGTLGPDTPERQVWSRINKISGKVVRSTMPALNDGGAEAVKNKEKASMCVKASQEVHNSTSLGVENINMREETLKSEGWKLDFVSEESNSYNVFFSLKELKDALQAGANTTPGQDKISYEMLKQLDDIALDEILALFNYGLGGGSITNKMETCCCNSNLETREKSILSFFLSTNSIYICPV